MRAVQLVVVAWLVTLSGCHLLGQDIPCQRSADCPASLPLCKDQVCVAGSALVDASVVDAVVADAPLLDATAPADAVVADATSADLAASDAATPDAQRDAASAPDALSSDGAAPLDAQVLDATGVDAGHPDSGPADTGVGSDLAPSPDSGAALDAGSDAGDAATLPDAAVPVTTCTDMPVVSVGSDTCARHSGSGPDLIIYGDLLLPDRVIVNGGVLMDALGNIRCVGCDCLAQAPTARTVVCPGAAVSSGLIDGRTHSSWSNAAPYNPVDVAVDPALRWEHRHDWRTGDGDDPEIPTTSDGSTQAKVWGELRRVLAGTTSANASGNGLGLVRDLSSESPRPGSSVSATQFSTFPLGDSSGAMRIDDCGYTGFTTRAAGKLFTPVVAEGIGLEAHNEFLCLSGADPAHDLLTAPAALMSAIALNATDVGVMAERGLGLIWTPRSDVSLYGNTSPIPLLRHLGVEIGLGTWWPVTGSRHLLHELECARQLGQDLFAGQLDHRELWRMVTFGAAAALGVDDAIGVLRPGLRGDVVVFAPAGRQHYQAVVQATQAEVALVLIDGKAVAGRSAVVEGLGASCSSFTSCGLAYTVCLDGTGQDWTTLAAAASTSTWQPLIACEPVAYERPCLAARTLAEDAVSGTRVHLGVWAADDQDGDGVLDLSDNCPTLFNPVRPMDLGAQADVDADGVGDVCDPCPLQADLSCTLRDRDDRDDRDGDGVDNWNDNCLALANPEQLDDDGDLIGDACDPCPQTPNPGGSACPATIYDVNTDPTLIGQLVAVSSVVVTAVGPRSFFVQAAQDITPGYGLVQHSGLYVYTGTAPTVAVRDIVDIHSAQVDLYYDLRELKNPQYLAVGQTQTLPAPVTLTAPDLSTQLALGKDSPFIGVLVQVESVTVQSVGSGKFTLQNSLVVDDELFPAMALPAVNSNYALVRGPLAWSFDALTVWPRDATDLQL